MTTAWGFQTIPKRYVECAKTLVVYRYKDIVEHPNETYRMIGDRQYRWLPDAMQAGVLDMLDLSRRMLAV